MSSYSGSDRARCAAGGVLHSGEVLLPPILLVALVTIALVFVKVEVLGVAFGDASIRHSPEYGLLLGLAFGASVLIAVLFDEPGAAGRPEVPRWAVLFAATTLAGSIAATCIFLASPSLFTALGKEDRPVEYASALAALAASGLFGISARTCVHRREGVLACLWLAGLAVVLFLIAGEEISWGQRILGFGTPEQFSANIQNETNFHNFATWTITTAYYAVGFVLLVLVPFLVPRWTHLGVEAADYLPSLATVLVAAPFVGFEYNRFGTGISEVTTCLTLLILAIFLLRTPPGPVRAILAALLPAIVLMQAIFLLYGEQQVRGWDTTEYRELLIAMGFLAFAAEVRFRQLGGRDA